ncbi:MAG: EAL domain-containing protein [Microcoleaceae cyanobacterium]
MAKLSQSKDKILLIDDNSENLGLLFNVLDTKGYEVRIAQDGESAIKKIEREPPQLILLDIMMPGIDGFETCTRIKSNPKISQIPIIFMSALSDSVDKIKGLQLGAVDYITKPFNEEEILARIQLHLRLFHLTEDLQEEIIERRNAEVSLQKLNQELEQKVSARTKELKNAIKELRQAYQELVEQKHQLEYIACYDVLTGLPNRNWLVNQLQNLIQKAKEDPNFRYAVMFIDLDNFKVINDSLGHTIGDQLLKKVAQRLQTSITMPNRIVRLGGDEFVIVLEGIQDMSIARTKAQAVLNQFQKPFEWGNYEYHLNASIGIFPSDMGAQEPVDILSGADLAMYSAKQAGRGCYKILTSQMQQQALWRLQIERELRIAIEKQEFCLYYQPIVSLKTGELAGFEALVRWQHPERGLVSPALFIPVAEETGLIHELGWWIFETAIAQLEEWQLQLHHLSHLTLNVNLSPIQLMREDLLPNLERILAQRHLERAHLKLEITESSLLTAQMKISGMWERLKACGIRLCIDDFGTGYSSLSRLQELPVDTLKIDRSFVIRLDAPKEDTAVVKTIITLAHTLGMDLVAEGVETKTQWEKLRAFGCESGQGYLFSKPVDAQKATEAIAQWQKGNLKFP